MKKFLKFGKNKKLDTSSGSLELPAGVNLTGYTLKEKDLGKLHKAAWTGDIAKVRQLAKKDPSLLDKENRTPLHLCCCKGHTDVVEELLAWKAKLNVGDNDQCTPLMKSVQCRQIECMKILLDSKADPNTQDTLGNSCLHYCAMDGVTNMAGVLIKYKAKTEIQNKEGQTPLHRATFEKQEEMCRVLLEGGANANCKDQSQRTPLMCAADAGHATLVKLLLHHKADTSLKDAKGWTADDCAVIAGHHGCSQLIADHITRQRRTPRGDSPRGHSPAHTHSSKRSTPMSNKSPSKQVTPTRTKPNLGAAAQGHGRATFQTDYSEPEDTESKMSEEPPGGDESSWAEDSEMDLLPSDRPNTKKKKVPTATLR